MPGRNLGQEATLWKVGPEDWTGKLTFLAPEYIMVKWEDRQEEFTAGDLASVRSNAVVFVGQDIALGDYLALGRWEELDPGDLVYPATAWVVQQFQKIPDIRNMENERKVYL